MLGRGIESGLGVIFIVLRNLKVLLRHGAVCIQVLCSFQLFSGQEFIGDRLAVGVESYCNVIAANSQQDLVFLDGVAEARADIDYAAGSKRNHRHTPRNVRKHDPRGDELRRSFVSGGRYRRILFGMFHREQRDVHALNHLLGRRRFLSRNISLPFSAAAKGQQGRQGDGKESQIYTFYFHEHKV